MPFFFSCSWIEGATATSWLTFRFLAYTLTSIIMSYHQLEGVDIKAFMDASFSSCERLSEFLIEYPSSDYLSTSPRPYQVECLLSRTLSRLPCSNFCSCLRERKCFLDLSRKSLQPVAAYLHLLLRDLLVQIFKLLVKVWSFCVLHTNKECIWYFILHFIWRPLPQQDCFIC